MLNKKQYEDKNKDKEIYKIEIPDNSYLQIKTNKDIHFISSDERLEDNFIETDSEGLKIIFNQIMNIVTQIGYLKLDIGE